ncbi:MAG: hypothetical protein UDQ48_05505, partial [Dialister sp.]|uniref:hypothetical protein n=1 Tax=Dialister sp. TaxID=1955814 RepID=UPI002E78A5D9
MKNDRIFSQPLFAGSERKVDGPSCPRVVDCPWSHYVAWFKGFRGEGLPSKAAMIIKSALRD